MAMIKTKQIQKPAVSAEDFKTSLQPPQEEKQLTEKNDPGGETANSNKDDVVTGVEYLVSVYRPVIVVDCHMHIMSGGCSPMPFLWKQLADKSVDVVEAMHLCLLYTSDAADDLLCVDLGGRRIIKKKNK